MIPVPAGLHATFTTVAVTGTNGKTTTTGMIEAIVRATGAPSARITTLGAWVGDRAVAEGPTLEAFVTGIECAHRAGVRTLALEVTSRALGNGFAQLWPANVAVFTNLSRDHIEYHGDPEHYLAAKAQLFMTLPAGGAAVWNACDPASALLDEVTPPNARRFGFARDLRKIPEDCQRLSVDLVSRESRIVDRSTHVLLEPSPLADALGGELVLGVLGDVNVENALAAALATHAVGCSPAHIVRGLAEFTGVTGRFERVWSNPLVVVDYAHTADALAATLALARKLVAPGGRVLVAFGCGGEADSGKRPEMGQVAVESADAVILTSDNPRNEDPVSIIRQILDGIARATNSPGISAEEGGPTRVRTTKGQSVSLFIEPDRQRAIQLAIAECNLGDIVVVAGKGHERTQRIANHVLPFDDAEVARQAARARFSGAKVSHEDRS
jgi:UDP-N-acetylmuramoyl-L-alanyl-D-glutamate--2,6-diaminopimelate ligase